MVGNPETQIAQKPESQNPETQIIVDINQIIYNRIRRAVKALAMEKKIKEEEVETVLEKTLSLVKHCDLEDMASADDIRVVLDEYIYEADCHDDIKIVVGKATIIDKEVVACNDRDIVYNELLPTYKIKAPAVVRIKGIVEIFTPWKEYIIVVPRQ